MRVLRATTCGFCHGVERAVRMAERLLAEGHRRVFTLGPLIHNPQEVARLAARGVLPRERIEDCQGAPVLVRTHGIRKDEAERARAIGLDLADATCPHVHTLRRAIQSFHAQGRLVLVLGDRHHPEIRAAVSHAEGPIQVVKGPDDIEPGDPHQAIGIAVQTTHSSEELERLVESVKSRSQDVEVANTICVDIRRRQAEVRQLARQTGTMVIVGGRNSANTRRLMEISQAEGAHCYAIESAKEIDPQWFREVQVVGLASGASTPPWAIDQVESHLIGLHD